MPECLKRALGLFPFSRFRPGATLRVLAISLNEPPLLERLYDEVEPDALARDAGEFLHSDAAFEVDCWWELWRMDPDWILAPSQVTISIYGPDFESDGGEQIRIDAGEETQYLPDASNRLSLRPIQSNVRSLLRLADDLDKALPVRRRAVWSDSGEDLAERIEESL